MTLLQYQMLHRIAFGQQTTLPVAYTLNQHTFGSLCKHHWLAFDLESETFIPTRSGLKALLFNLKRTNPRAKLSKHVTLKSNRIHKIA